MPAQEPGLQFRPISFHVSKDSEDRLRSRTPHPDIGLWGSQIVFEEDFETAGLLARSVGRSEALFLCVPEAAIVATLLDDWRMADKILEEAGDLPVPFFRSELVPYANLRAFLAGELGDEEFVALAQSPPQTSYSHLMIAMKALADNRYDQAEDQLALAVETSWSVRQWHMNWADAYLAQMRNDPNWPAGRK